jgi:iron complex transport system permease protein
MKTTLSAPESPPLATSTAAFQPLVRRAKWLLLSALLIVVLILAATLGAPVPFSDLWSSDASRAQVAQQIFWRYDGNWGVRPIRVLAAALVGASLAVSGSALQAVFRNPLAEPYLLGVSSGGALGAAIGLASRFANFRVLGFDISTVLAFGGALFASFLIYVLGQRRDGNATFNRAGLLVTGVAVSAFLSSLMALVVALSHRDDLARQITFWMMGNLSHVSPSQNGVLLVTLIVGLGLMFSSSRDLNALRLGDDEAQSLGVSVRQLHARLLLASALMSASCVAAAGLIGFVGLLAPHGVRLLFGSDARMQVPAAAIGGATLLVACDALARSVAQPIELPVGVITALLGVPLFLFLARR